VTLPEGSWEIGLPSAADGQVVVRTTASAGRKTAARFQTKRVIAAEVTRLILFPG
jgi:hypothetical protein